MKHTTVAVSFLCVPLLLFEMALAQDVQVDLVFEKALPSRTHDVGIDYDERGWNRPVWDLHISTKLRQTVAVQKVSAI